MSALFLLDTNVLSEPTRARPDPGVMSALASFDGACVTGAPVWHELQFGVRRLEPSRRRARLETYLRSTVERAMDILPYDEQAAAWHAAERTRLVGQGRTPAFVDGQIAAIAAVRGLILVTRNVGDFSDFDGLAIERWHSG